MRPPPKGGQGRALRGRRGRAFTLVETVVAMAIFTMGFAGIFGLTVWFLRAGAFSRDLTEAATLAQDRMESMRAESFYGITSGSDQVGEFSRTWTVAMTGSVKVVGVAVTWEDAAGVERTVQVTTARTE